METFSERYGYIKKPLLVEMVSASLRNRIWNFYSGGVFVDESDYDSNYLEEILDCLGLPVKRIFNSLAITENLELLKYWFRHAEWYQVYDFVEIYLNFVSPNSQPFIRDGFNAILKQENSGYRVLGTNVIPITNKGELECIQTAQETAYDNVNIHIKKATELYARRPEPDYENSIKESISAVEATCCIITGESGKQATLGNTLKKLKDNEVHIHSAMEKAFLSLYGYTSDESGIRHGGIDFKGAPAEDAKIYADFLFCLCKLFD